MLLIKNGRIKTMAGANFENGYVLIEKESGKILSVGESIDETPDMEITDAGGRLVTPGCVEAHCHLGVHNSAVRWEGADYNEKSDPITPHIRAIDGINPIVGGTFAAIKLFGKRVDKMIIKNPVAMKCAFGENPKGAYGQNGSKAPVTRMATAALLRNLLFKTREYLEAKESGKEPTFDIKLEAMIPVIKKEIPLKAHAHRADDIFTAIRIAKEFDVLLTLDHCTDGALIADELGEEGYPAFVGPSFTSKSKIELSNKSFSTPAILHAAGVPISIITDAPVTPIENLTMCAGFAVAEGLPYEVAWKAITVNPANQTGIGDRVGSLEAGKDGDVVIWNDDPLVKIGTKAYVTVIEGKVVYRATEC